MAIALVAHTKGSSSNSNGFTTSAIDTTGANLLVAVIADQGGPTSPLSDSKGNTWLTGVAPQGPGAGPKVRILYAKSPTVGSGHTFTITETFGYPFLALAAFSGADTSAPLDQTNFNVTTANTLAAGSITPTAANELVVTGTVSSFTNSGTFSIDSSYSIVDSTAGVAGNAYGGGLADIVQTTAAATNPAWTNSGGLAAAVIASFKAGVTGTTYTLSGSTTQAQAVVLRSAPVRTYRDAILAESSLVAFWELQETSGTSAADSKGTRTGTYGGSTYTLGQAGPGSGKSAQFGGAGYINIPSVGTLMGAWTAEAWIRTSTGTLNAYMGSRGASEYGFDSMVNANKLHNDIGSGSGWITTGADQTSGPNLNDNGWHHVVLALSTTTWAVYVDGASVGSGSFGASTPVAWDASHTLRLGTNNHGDGWFTGYLAYCAMYNATLNVTQVSAHYAAMSAVTYLATGSTTQSQTLRLAMSEQLRRTVTQAQALSLTAARVFLRTVSATQAQSVVVLRAFSRIVALTQAQALALVAGRSSGRTVTAQQGQALVLRRSSSLQRTVTQAQGLRLLSAVQRTLALAQSTSASLRRQFSVTRLVTQAQAVSRVIGRGYQRVVTATQSTAVRMPRVFSILLTITGSRRVRVRATLARAQLGRVLRLSQPTTARVVRRITLTRAVTVAQSVSLSGVPVQLQAATVIQTRSLALGRFVSLVRTITQSTLAWMPSGLDVVRTIVQPTLLERSQAVTLTRSLTQAQSVSVLAQNVTPRLFITLTTSVGQSVSLSQAQGAQSARNFVVIARAGDFVVSERAGPFAVRRRGVRFTVEER